MIGLTKKEQEALLMLYKDFTNFHNANSLSKKIGITQVGAMKLLKKLEKQNILSSKKIGKSIVYKLNIKEELVRKLIGFALTNEASSYERWIDEFKPLYKKGMIILFYGSASRDYAQARDIDIMIILKKEGTSDVYEKLREKQKILQKKIHSIEAAKDEFIRNLKENNKAILEIVRTAIVLYGYDDYMEILDDFTSF